MRPFLALSPPAASLSDLLGRSAHAFTRDEVLARWPRSELDRCLAGGTATRILPGVYCAPAHRNGRLVLGESLNLWVPRGLVTGELALSLYSEALPVPETADLVVPYGSRVRNPTWVRVMQRAPVAVESGPRGVRCVIAARAAVDAWSNAAPRERRELLYLALWNRACTWRQVRRELARTPRIRGRHDLERVLGWFAEGATSPLEVRAKHEVFTGTRFAELEWQVDLRLPTRKPTVDILHRRARVIVELDGDTYHSTRKARDEDRNRQTDLIAAGFVVIRFGWRDIVDRPEWCRERVLTVVAQRLSIPWST
ncbi:endonuclease domain-containing protein [Demequina capsici]|uniref:DUF559 domain-containing protein n=1 Tax=Demequina capsici TaxID=3075620 RepID=A0AA96F6Q6_9MICO|nr:DUF559 domain-containing protein [Demequina sp. OYTSA14]WNM23807.1 DUF559 domain-containing protein [Demequina sp. OYTSA14]